MIIPTNLELDQRSEAYLDERLSLCIAGLELGVEGGGDL